MVYRAKITKIRAWIENHYNTCAFHIVKDMQDAYIELPNEDEAELIEELNRLQTKKEELTKYWYKRYGIRTFK